MNVNQKLAILAVALLSGGVGFTIGKALREPNQPKKQENMSDIIERAENATMGCVADPQVAPVGTEITLKGLVENSGANDISFVAAHEFPDCIIYVKRDGELVNYTGAGSVMVSPFRGQDMGGGWFLVDGNSTREFSMSLSGLFDLSQAGEYVVICKFEGYGMPTVTTNFTLQ